MIKSIVFLKLFSRNMYFVRSSLLCPKRKRAQKDHLCLRNITKLCIVCPVLKKCFTLLNPNLSIVFCAKIHISKLQSFRDTVLRAFLQRWRFSPGYTHLLDSSTRTPSYQDPKCQCQSLLLQKGFKNSGL